MKTKKIANDLKGVIGCAQEAEFAFRVSGVHDDPNKSDALKQQGVESLDRLLEQVLSIVLEANGVGIAPGAGTAELLAMTLNAYK